MKAKVIILFVAASISMFLTGCMGNRANYNQRNFVLQADRDLPVVKDSKDIILAIQSFNSSELYADKSFVYRIAKSEYETDFYNRFLVAPDDMLTQITRKWLSDSGVFKLVLESGTYTDATEMLEGNLLALYGDFENKDNPKATVRIRFFVIKLSDKSVLFSKTYEVSSAAKDNSIESLVDAYNESIKQILTQLEKDLQKNL